MLTKEIILKGIVHRVDDIWEFPFKAHIYSFYLPFEIDYENDMKEEWEGISSYCLSVACGMNKKETLEFIYNLAKKYDIKLTKKEIYQELTKEHCGVDQRY